MSHITSNYQCRSATGLNLKQSGAKINIIDSICICGLKKIRHAAAGRVRLFGLESGLSALAEVNCALYI